MHGWGYAPALEALADGLLGGSVPAAELARVVEGSGRISIEGGVVFLQGHESLARASRARVASDRFLNGHARSIAEAFARDLVRACPFVECVALAGSAGSGGFAHGDDLDFDLFVARGTKYTTYLVANLIGARYAWRYRRVPIVGARTTPLLRKVICINVVWPEDQTRPFVRRDEGLAFELARCVPLFGSRRFEQALADNPWIADLLPQALARRRDDSVARGPSSVVGRFLRAVGGHPRLMRIVEGASRLLAWAAYSLVQAARRRDPVARARIEFLRRVKYPYEVFQD